MLERLRASAYATLPNLSRVPTDVFVWRAGEPTRREVTKIAGLPYRPARRPCPQSPSGEQLTFVAQFCFADSRDLVPALPGDVLLIFATGEFFATGEPDPHPRRRFELLWGLVSPSNGPPSATFPSWRPPTSRRRLGLCSPAMG